MKIPQNVEEAVERIATLQREIRENEAVLFEWLGVKGIDFNAFSEMGCAYSTIQDGYSSDFLECLRMLNSKNKKELTTDYK